MPLPGLPAKKLVVPCARFCALARSAIWSKRGRPAHLEQVEDWKSDMKDWCFGGLSSREHGSRWLYQLSRWLPLLSPCSVRPALTCTRTAGCAICSAPTRAATTVEVCDVETSRTSSAGPNAPSTSPWRSVFVQHGRPAEYRWQRACRKHIFWVRAACLSGIRKPMSAPARKPAPASVIKSCFASNERIY